MQMRPSRVLSKLRSGKIASCVKLNLSDPQAAEIAALCGIDCVWIDMEHVPNDLSAINGQIRVAKIHDVDTLVRVPRGSYSNLIHPLEMDAAGIMVPHVMSADDARQIVRQTRFHPLGRRPLDGGGADAAFCMVPVDQYIRHANHQRFVVVQIEDPEPMADLEAIAQIPGIDMLFFGPGDYSHGIGNVGDMSDPRIADARRRIAEAAGRHGKFAGTVASLASLAETAAMGYHFISVGADVCGLVDYFRRTATAFDELDAASKPVNPS